MELLNKKFTTVDVYLCSGFITYIVSIAKEKIETPSLQLRQ